MASLSKRSDTKKSERYRVAFKKRGYRHFSLTFDDWDVACKWAEENEHKYYEDLNHYHNWKLELFLTMQKKRLDVLNHIIKPKIYK